MMTMVMMDGEDGDDGGDDDDDDHGASVCGMGIDWLL